MEPGTSHEVLVRVSVPEGQPAGLYHGLLVGSGAPDGAIIAARRGAGVRARGVMTVAGTDFLDQLNAYDAIARRAALSYLRTSGVSSYVGLPAADYLQRSGKGLRPALCLATCTAFGGDVEDALPSAAAIELFHTALLVHDDVEDDSELRRGAPTLHRRYGRALAMNAGDGLAVLALGALRDNESRLGRWLSDADLVGVRPHGPADGRRTGQGARVAAGGSHRPDS